MALVIVAFVLAARAYTRPERKACGKEERNDESGCGKRHSGLHATRSPPDHAKIHVPAARVRLPCPYLRAAGHLQIYPRAHLLAAGRLAAGLPGSPHGTRLRSRCAGTAELL